MDSNKTSRKYNSIFRKKLITKINRIKNKEELIEIYNIVINDIGNNFLLLSTIISSILTKVLSLNCANH